MKKTVIFKMAYLGACIAISGTKLCLEDSVILLQYLIQRKIQFVRNKYRCYSGVSLCGCPKILII